jgi:hypothetical protein
VTESNDSPTPSSNIVTPELAPAVPADKHENAQPLELPDGIYKSMLDGLNNFKQE